MLLSCGIVIKRYNKRLNVDYFILEFSQNCPYLVHNPRIIVINRRVDVCKFSSFTKTAPNHFIKLIYVRVECLIALPVEPYELVTYRVEQVGLQLN